LNQRQLEMSPAKFPFFCNVGQKHYEETARALVAQKYGMIHTEQSKTETVRCVFVIDPESKIRAMIYYPLTTGRNMKEILRLIDALQTTDKHKVATPTNWKPGDPVVVPPPATAEQAEERLKEGCKCKDWYLCFKKL
jgi:peroxiredoxin (alkyl hydroperoxide reductase subunit C)